MDEDPRPNPLSYQTASVDPRPNPLSYQTASVDPRPNPLSYQTASVDPRPNPLSYQTASVAQWLRWPSREPQKRGSILVGAVGFFSGSSHIGDFKIGTLVATRKVPGGIGSALGLVGPVSVYRYWVRWKF